MAAGLACALLLVLAVLLVIASCQSEPPVRPLKTTVPMLSRGPTLARITQSSVEIHWRTQEPAACTLAPFGCTSTGVDHVFVRSGLLPNHSYPYEISIAGQVVAAGVARTAPTASDRVTAAAIADAGAGSLTQRAIAMRIDELDPRLVLDVGDICYPNWADATRPDQVFFSPDFYGRFLPRIPVYTTAGGHDLESASGNAYYDTFHLPGDERNYITRWGPIDFVAVDYSREFSSHPLAVAVLDSLLKTSTAPWKVVFVADLCYSSGVTHGESQNLRAALEPLLLKHRVALVLQGREHHYERLGPVVRGSPSAQGPIYLTIGGGGNEGLYGFGTPKPYSVVRARVNHFVWMEATARQLRVRCLDPLGNQVDAFTCWISSRRGGGRTTN
jgi:hypothetical protein